MTERTFTATEVTAMHQAAESKSWSFAIVVDLVATKNLPIESTAKLVAQLEKLTDYLPSLTAKPVENVSTPRTDGDVVSRWRSEQSRMRLPHEKPTRSSRRRHQHERH